MPKRLVKNRFRCKKCGQILESKTRHDFVSCSCGNFVDGGTEVYMRLGGNLDDLENLCEYEEKND